MGDFVFLSFVLSARNEVTQGDKCMMIAWSWGSISQIRFNSCWFHYDCSCNWLWANPMNRCIYVFSGSGKAIRSRFRWNIYSITAVFKKVVGTHFFFALFGPIGAHFTPPPPRQPHCETQPCSHIERVQIYLTSKKRFIDYFDHINLVLCPDIVSFLWMLDRWPQR